MPDRYAIGSDAAERERLAHQGRALAPATRVLLEAAGVRPGMRVLDLGSGAGDVSLLVAEIVGAAGSVLGLDQSGAAVAAANERARDAGVAHVHFVEGDVREPAPDGPFDAIVGRLVLMYVDDPAEVLRTQAAGLRDGGLVAPVEIDVGTARSLPPTPLVAQAIAWIGDAFTRAGVDAALGPKLWAVLDDAGLRPLGMAAVQPHFGPDDRTGAEILAGVVRAVLPLIETTGTARRPRSTSRPSRTASPPSSRPRPRSSRTPRCSAPGEQPAECNQRFAWIFRPPPGARLTTTRDPTG